jgi:hypothetical protein
LLFVWILINKSIPRQALRSTNHPSTQPIILSTHHSFIHSFIHSAPIAFLGCALYKSSYFIFFFIYWFIHWFIHSFIHCLLFIPSWFFWRRAVRPKIQYFKFAFFISSVFKCCLVYIHSFIH